MRHITPISGKYSLATALIMLQQEPDLPMEYVWHDTGWELPEVHKWISDVENALRITIIRCGDDLDEIIQEQGLLPSPMRRFCTKYAKIKPMRELVGKVPVTLYLGLRADEPSRISGLTPSKWESHRFPLSESGFGLSDVWRIVSTAMLTPPQFTWQWMLDRVFALGGRRPATMPEWEWLSLFAGRSRTNCDRCFYQRQYEWIWLSETHPERFAAAVQTEESTQHASPYRWLGPGIPLASIVDRSEEIKEKRARAIAAYLRDMNTPTLFPLASFNPLGTRSCGLFCG